MSENKTLVRFNIQNAKYALLKSGGTYDTPIDLGTSTKIALQRDASVKKIYGDGRRIAAIVNDKGETGTLTQNNINDGYEVAMGRKLQTANGLASIKQTKNITHALYFETCGYAEDGSMPVAKTWLYGVTSSAPSENYEQNTDDINESTFDLPLEIVGTNLMSSDGTAKYKDDKGNEVIVTRLTVYPGDADYDTFGNSVPVPKMAK